MFALVDANNFYVSCERVVDPRLKGKAVAVLSNNDGCCVSCSNEFKALGIARGTPYFQLRDRERRGEIVFRSSNYELYGDLSRRIVSILRDEALDVAQYSIDEAFVTPPALAAPQLLAWGARLRAKILQWVGIPCSVGFAPTRTLAKIANHIGKKSPSGVYVLPDDPAEILRALPPSEVWGVGRQLTEKLRAHGILSADELRRAREEELRGIGGVALVRTAAELRGIAGADERAYDADPDSISCSRSFGEPVTTLEGLGESLASFTALAARKLRRHHLLAAGANLYAQLGSAYEGHWTARTVVFPSPTDHTGTMLAAIRRELPALWVDGARYRKSGMVFFGLETPGSVHQLDLFAPPETHEASPLYRAVDAINARFGSRTVFSAAEGPASPTWKMRREKLSPRATTNWNELIVAK